MSVDPQKPNRLQQLPKTEPRQVWPPVAPPVVPQRPFSETGAVGVDAGGSEVVLVVHSSMTVATGAVSVTVLVIVSPGTAGTVTVEV